MIRRRDSIQISITEEEYIDKIKRPKYTSEQIQTYKNEHKWYYKILKFFRIV